MTGKQRLIVAALCAATLAGGAAWADGPRAIETPASADGAMDGGAAAEVDALMDAARLRPLMGVVALEGARHGIGLEGALFPGRGGDAWADRVRAIQSPDRLVVTLEAALAEGLGDAALASAADFYGGALGAKVAAGEVAARRAMLDADAEAEAMVASAGLAAEGGPRAELTAELIDALDLVTANVSGGLNANFAFYRGLADGGAMTRPMSEREMLAMVWEQEADVREATARWLDAYLLLAYERLSDGELAAYVDWAASPEGRKMNAAVFAGFGQVFEETSYALGREAARFMAMTDT